jgi:hypothetical protein
MRDDFFAPAKKPAAKMAAAPYFLTMYYQGTRGILRRINALT